MRTRRIIPASILLSAIALFDFGRPVRTYLATSEAVHEAGRAAALGATDSATVVQDVKGRLAARGLDASLAVAYAAVRPNGWPGQPTDSILVIATIPYEFTLAKALLGWTGADTSVNLSSWAVFRRGEEVAASAP